MLSRESTLFLTLGEAPSCRGCVALGGVISAGINAGRALAESL